MQQQLRSPEKTSLAWENASSILWLLFPSFILSPYWGDGVGVKLHTPSKQEVSQNTTCSLLLL